MLITVQDALAWQQSIREANESSMDTRAGVIEEAVKTLCDTGGFLRELLGTAGLRGGKWLNARRAEDLTRALAHAEMRLERDGLLDSADSVKVQND